MTCLFEGFYFTRSSFVPTKITFNLVYRFLSTSSIEYPDLAVPNRSESTSMPEIFDGADLLLDRLGTGVLKTFFLETACPFSDYGFNLELFITLES